MNTHEKRKQRFLKNPKHRELYERELLIHDLSVKMRKIREKKGWTQTELAEKMGTSQPAIAKWESGNATFSIVTLSKFCEVTEMHLDIIKNPHILKDGYKNVFDIACYFVAKTDPSVGDIMTNLKLQKLVYYAKAWHLAKYQHPLFEDSIEAWTLGPVVPALYNNLKQVGNAPITTAQIGGCKDNIDQDTQKFLDTIWEHYGRYEGWYLSELTHREEPWKRARKGMKDDERSNAVIDEAFVGEYYKGEIGEIKKL